MKIFLQDTSFAHCEFSNNPVPVKQRTDEVTWDRTDNYTEEDIVVWTDACIPKSSNRKGPNIAWLVESRALISQLYNFVEANSDKFEAIWTFDRELLKLSNAVKLPIGGCWVDDFDWAIHPKTKNFSIIASAKNEYPGHKQRHQIVAGAGGYIDVFGRGYNPIQDKIDGLRDYRYHFCIENNKCDYYFTEKLIDSFVTGTLPIYWGCPSIGDFFNTDGMICYDDIKELPNLLKKCTPEYYESKMEAMKENFELAKKYRLAELTIPNLLK